MPNIFFTSDTHFGHAKILNFCPETRPFSSVTEMDESIVSAWNNKVSPNDVIYHLGDVSWRSTTEAYSILERLNGTKHLVLGNHDNKLRKHEKCMSLFASVQDYKEIKIDNLKIILMHFPIESWNCQHFGSLHLHGHTHGNTSYGRSNQLPNRMDIGIDTRKDYSPWAWEEIKAELKL